MDLSQTSSRGGEIGNTSFQVSFVTSAVIDTPPLTLATFGIAISTENVALAPMDVDSGGICDKFRFQ